MIYFGTIAWFKVIIHNTHFIVSKHHHKDKQRDMCHNTAQDSHNIHNIDIYVSEIVESYTYRKYILERSFKSEFGSADG